MILLTIFLIIKASYGLDWTNYHNLRDHRRFLYNLQRSRPGVVQAGLFIGKYWVKISNNQVENVGKTLRKQNLLLVKVCGSGKVRVSETIGYLISTPSQVRVQGCFLDREVVKIRKKNWMNFGYSRYISIIYFDHKSRWRNTCPWGIGSK